MSMFDLIGSPLANQGVFLRVSLSHETSCHLLKVTCLILFLSFVLKLWPTAYLRDRIRGHSIAPKTAKCQRRKRQSS